MSLPTRLSTRRPAAAYTALLMALAPALLLLALAAPARAGTWQFAAAGSTGSATLTHAMNGGTINTPPWTPPSGTSTGSLTVFGNPSPHAPYGISGSYGSSASVTVNLKITVTWVPDPNLPSDPAPPSVWITEGAKTEYTGDSGTASDGLGDTMVLTPASGPPTGGTSDSTNAALAIPPKHWTKMSGSSFTINRTLTATAASSATYGCTMSCYVDGYTIGIHAQPYNFHLNGYTDGGGIHHNAVEIDNVNGTLAFHYFFNSTDGNLGSLSAITMYELLDWSGNPAPPGIYPPGGYIPPSPPVSPYSDGALYAYRSPDKEADPNVLQGLAFDTFSPPTTGFVAPFTSTTWSVTQSYLFDDSQTGEMKVKVPGPDNNSPFTITRSVTPGVTTSTGTYTITTRGYSATKSLP